MVLGSDVPIGEDSSHATACPSIMIQVRPYVAADSRAVARLFRELSRTHRELYPGLRVAGSRALDGWFHLHMRRYGARSLRVAEEDGRVVGVVGLIAHRGRGEVEPLVVAKNCRRRGVGLTLIHAVVEEARRRRWKSLTVGVAPRNRVALRAFHALGFRALTSLDLQMRLQGPVRFPLRPGPQIVGRRFQW